MDFRVAWNRLSSRLQKRDVHRTIGRFNTVRQTYSWLQKHKQAANPDYYRAQLNPRESSLFPQLSPERCAQELRENSVSFGFQLPSELVHQVHTYACQSPLYEPGSEDEFFADDIKGGKLPTGRPVLRGLVKNPSHCPAVEAVAEDPMLLEIAHAYLQYWPTKVTRHLTWAFVSCLPVAEQKALFLPLSYHYDVAGYNFMSAYFYITAMDAQTGAHVMIERSHQRKPLHTLWAPWSGRQPDDVLLNYYGQENERLIEGPAGFGFVQDPSCFHKLLSPIKQKRLLLQIRYA